MIKHAIYVAIAILLAAAMLSVFQPSDAQALDQIIRPYQSVRSAGMGSVTLTTGLYDENFFGNPGRVTKNPTWRIQLPGPMIESTMATITSVSDLIDADDLSKVADKTGTNFHARVQTTFPGLYLVPGRMGYAFALITSTQADIGLRKSFNLSPQVIVDVGPALTVGREFLKDDALSVGATIHATYRLASEDGFSLADVLAGKSLAPSQSGGDGAHIDAGVGATYMFPHAKPLGFDLTTALAITNILGGSYTNLDDGVINNGLKPPKQFRAVGVGVSMSKDELFIFEKPVFAFEIRDMFNNPNGSFFRLLHFGGEAHWKVLIARLGINQGYPTAGLGVALKVFELDAAYYGEEMSLNAGGQVDHRLALRLSFQI